MSTIIRDRSQSDDRHAIRDPFGPDARDMSVFTNTLMRERIPQLFQTAAGFAGHAQQLQQELNRLANVEGRSGAEIERAVSASKCLKAALLKSKDGAVENGFPFGVHWHDHNSFSAA